MKNPRGYMRVRPRAAMVGDTCDKPGCKELGRWWGASYEHGKLRMCNEHKTDYADELLKEDDA